VEKAVSAADAKRKFSKLLREVREGQSYVVTSHGRAVAKIVPTRRDAGVARGAKAALLKRFRSEPVGTIGRRSRDGLYKDKARE
jgi:prevent-host-death family protein